MRRCVSRSRDEMRQQVSTTECVNKARTRLRRAMQIFAGARCGVAIGVLGVFYLRTTRTEGRP